MADRLRIGVILLQAVEDHCFFFGGMGIKPAHAPCFLHDDGVRLGTHAPVHRRRQIRANDPRPVDAMLNQVWTCNAITESLNTGQTITRG